MNKIKNDIKNFKSRAAKAAKQVEAAKALEQYKADKLKEEEDAAAAEQLRLRLQRRSTIKL